MKRILVGVTPAAEHDRYRRLLDALEGLFPVSFSCEPAGSSKTADARLVLAANRGAALATAQNNIPCYAVMADGGGVTTEPDLVQFHRVAALEAHLRGQILPDLEQCPVAPIECQAGDEPVASKAGKVFWIHRAGQGDSGALDLVGIAPPVLKAGEHLAQFFFRESFLRLLPLIQWLKRITAPVRWQSAPPRACLVFDDPTLPAPSYGCLNFAKLAAHAQKFNYHAVVATVPLSSRRVSPENAALFRDHAPHLSLVIHGNDHIWHELARVYPEAECLAILAQAWHRIVAMEQDHGIAVGRIMEAPYGIIDQGMIEPLVRLGYEATLITPSQFLSHNHSANFSPTIGLNGIEFLPGGLCLLPRIKMSPQWKTDAMLALLLDQPVIIVGHHYDAVQDMERMREIAVALNEVAGLRWMSLPEIARSQYQFQTVGTQLCVRLGSRKVFLAVPDGVQTITVERPWLNDDSAEPLLIRSGDGTSAEQRVTGGREVEFTPGGAKKVELAAPSPQAVDPMKVPTRGVQVWPLVRRLLMESRDRMYPYLHRPAPGVAANSAKSN